jgi:hypothetical protein
VNVSFLVLLETNMTSKVNIGRHACFTMSHSWIFFLFFFLVDENDGSFYLNFEGRERNCTCSIIGVAPCSCVKKLSC